MITKEQATRPVRNLKIMKAIWSDMFYGIEECNDTNEQATERVGNAIRRELLEIKYDIKDLNPKEAIEKIDEMMKTY